MKSGQSLREFCGYFLSVVLKPWIWFWIFGLPTAIISFATLVRDNLLPREWQEKLATQKYLPHWQGRSVIHNGFVAWRQQKARCATLEAEIEKNREAPLPSSAPQVELGSETTSDFPVNRLLLRNISPSEPIYNISFQSMRIGDDIFVSWQPEIQPVLQPMTMMQLTPIVRTTEGLPIDFKGVYAIVELIKKKRVTLYKKTPQPSRLNLGSVAFSCEDRVQSRYLVTFTVDISYSGRDLRVRDVDRRRIGSRPSRG